MPSGGKVIHRVEQDIEGAYLSINYTDSNLAGEILRFEQDGDTRIEIYRSYVQFVDSLQSVFGFLTPIDSAWVHDRVLYLKHQEGIQQFTIDDSLVAKGETLDYIIDLEQGFWLDKEHADSMGVGYDTLGCRIMFAQGSYYLNLETIEGQYKIIRGRFDGHTLYTLSFSISSSDSTDDKVDIASQFELKAIRDEWGYKTKNYRAQLSDPDFFRLEETLQSKYETKRYLFHKPIFSLWHYLLFGGLLAVILIAFLYFVRKKQ
ncbi:MAG: hypothetical protein ACFB10_23785 [Salibacteraceae bacterium]|mgnify:CR=1 FL=1